LWRFRHNLSGGFAVKTEAAFCFNMKHARSNRMRF
jgi:hypothetical protein